MSRVVLIEALPRRTDTGATTMVRMAGGGTRAYTQLGVLDWRAGIAAAPRFAAELGFDQSGWTGGALPQTGAIRFYPSRPEQLAELAALYWIDAAITLRMGDDEAAAPAYPTALVGAVASIQIAGGAMTLTLTDLSSKLAVPVVADRFGGSGGIEGDAGIAGRVKRRSWGQVWNVEGRILNAANNIYEFGDPARPLNAFVQLRDIGRAGSMQTLAWQGSIGATYSALAAATAPRGGGVAAPSIAAAKWWTTPMLLTADIKGEVGAGYVETAPAIAGRIAGIGGVTIDNIAALAALRPDAAGIHVGNESETIAQALDRLLLNNGVLWLLQPAGTIALAEVTLDGVAVEDITSTSVSREGVLKPVRARRLGYQRNERRQDAGEVAADLGDAPIGLVSNGNCTVDGMTVTKTGGADVWDDAGAVSVQGWTGGAMMSFRAGQTNKAMIIGLSRNAAANNNYASQDYCFYCQADALARVRVGNINMTAPAAYTSSTIFSIVYDNAVVRFYIDGALVWTETANVAAGHHLFVDSSLNHLGASFTVLDFSAAGGAGSSAKALIVTSDRQTIAYDGAGALSPAAQPITFTAFRQNTAVAASWALTDLEGNALTFASYLTGAGDVRTMTAANFNAALAVNGSKGVIVSASITDGTTISDKISVIKVQAGSNALSALLTNESANVPADAAGAVASFAGAGGSMKVYLGTADVTGLCGFALLSSAGVTIGIAGSGAYAPTAMSADAGSATFRASYGAATIDKVYNIAKSRVGATGTAGAPGAAGVPGAAGANGQTFFNWHAYADSADGTLNFTTGLPNGRSWVGTATNKTTDVEGSNPGDYVWVRYTGPGSFGLVNQANVTIGPDWIEKTSGAGAWDASGYSSEAFRGGAQVSCTVKSGDDFFLGLNTDPTLGSSWEGIDFGIYVITGGALRVTESGTITDVGTWAAGDRLQVHYDNKNVRYYKNGAVLRTVAAASNLTLYLDSSLFQYRRITGLAFTAAGAAGIDGANGVNGQPGPPGASGTNGANAPALVIQFSVNGATGWHSPFANGDAFMRTSSDGGTVFGTAIRFLGQTGSARYFLWTRSPTQPAEPPGAQFSPSGWSAAPPTNSADPLWQISAYWQDTSTNLSITWGTPIRVDGASGVSGIFSDPKFLRPSAGEWSLFQLGNGSTVEDSVDGRRVRTIGGGGQTYLKTVHVPCSDGDRIDASADLYFSGASGGAIAIWAELLNNSLGPLGLYPNLFSYAPGSLASGQWNLNVSGSAICTGGAAYVRLYIQATHTGGDIYVRNPSAQIVPKALVNIAADGTAIGGLLLDASTLLNAGSVVSGFGQPVATANSNTISINQHSRYFSGASTTSTVAADYQAGSIGGLAAGTTYYVFCYDPNKTGNPSGTYSAATSPTALAVRGRVHVTTITTSADGSTNYGNTGSGSSGSGTTSGGNPAGGGGQPWLNPIP